MSAQVTILQLPAAGAITGTEAVPIVQNGVTVQTTTGAIAASPSQPYTYLTVTQTPQLANSRYVGVTNGLVLTDGGAQGLFNISTTGALLSLVNSSTGFQVKTDSVTLTNRSIAVTNAGLSITNGSGVSGNPTISLDGQVLNFANLSANGLVTITTAGGVSSTSILGTASQISVSNGNAVGGSPTIGIASNPTLPGAAGVLLPFGTTLDRSVAPTNGTLRYNTDFALLEAYLNNNWASLASGSGVTSILTGTGLTGGPITSTGTISIANTTVTAGSYGSSTEVGTFTVNAQGQLTAAANVSITPASIGAVSSVLGTANEITATPAGSVVTLSLPSSLTFTGKTITGGTYTSASISGSTNTLSNIGNASLTNSSLTIGTTSIALGATSLTLGGLTSVTVTQDPVSNLQLATKQYVDTLVSSGIHFHEPVRVESPINLNATYNQPGGAGDGVGATLTNAGTQAALVIDGVTLSVSDRVLIYSQTTQTQNGVYVVTDVGSVSTNWVLTRSTDTDTYGLVSPTTLGEGSTFFVQQGATGAGETYTCNTTGVIVFGTTNITFAQISSAQIYSAGAGLTLNGTVFSLITPVTAILGGTGQTSYANGDLLYASSSTALSKLTLGASGYVLTAGASAPEYVAQSTLSVGSATTATNLAGGIASQIPYQTAAGTTAFIANGTAGQVLTSAGTSVPTWSGISGGTF
jgi:hypothetical protein